VPCINKLDITVCMADEDEDERKSMKHTSNIIQHNSTQISNAPKLKDVCLWDLANKAITQQSYVWEDYTQLHGGPAVEWCAQCPILPTNNSEQLEYNAWKLSQCNMPKIELGNMFMSQQNNLRFNHDVIKYNALRVGKTTGLLKRDVFFREFVQANPKVSIDDVATMFDSMQPYGKKPSPLSPDEVAKAWRKYLDEQTPARQVPAGPIVQPPTLTGSPWQLYVHGVNPSAPTPPAPTSPLRQPTPTRPPPPKPGLTPPPPPAQLLPQPAPQPSPEPTPPPPQPKLTPSRPPPPLPSSLQFPVRQRSLEEYTRLWMLAHIRKYGGHYPYLKYPRYVSPEMDDVGSIFPPDRSMYIYLPKVSLIDFKKAMHKLHINYNEKMVDEEYYRTFEQ